MTRKLVVIESPYAGDIERNLTYASRAMAWAIERSMAPIASHLLYTQPGILDDAKPDQRTLGMFLGYEWMKQAHEVYFFEDYGWSSGMVQAKHMAALLGKRVRTIQIGRNDKPLPDPDEVPF